MRKGDPPGGLHYASLRSGPSHFATLRLTTSPLWAPPPTLVRGCTSPLEGIPSAVPGSHLYYCLFLRTNPGLRPSHPCLGLILRTRLVSDPSLLPSPLKHTYHVLDYLQCITPCFNHPLNTPLKHTHPVLSRVQGLTLCFNRTFHPRLKHTYPVQTHLHGHVLCFNHPFNTPLKHTHHVLGRLQDLTLCFNHSLHPRLKYTYPVQTHLLRHAPCFNVRMLPEGKRNPLGPFNGAREGSR